MTEDVSGALPEGEVLPEPANTTQTADPSPAEQQEGQSQEQQPHKPDPVQRRIDRLTREKYQERARAQMLQQQIAQMEQQFQAHQPQQTGNAEPQLSDYGTLQEYIDAKAAFIARRESASVMDGINRQMFERQQAAAQHQMRSTFHERVQAFAAQTPDFDDVIEAGDFVPSMPMAHAMMESEIGPRIAYYLAQHSDEAQRIATLPPAQAIRAIGRIEAKLEAQPVKNAVSHAPNPVNPVGSNASASKDPNKMSMDDWVKWRNAQLKR